MNPLLLDQIEDPVPLPIPPRSRLYHLAPIGIGTPRVESLTSYISRLAQAHSVTTGTLVTRDISYTIEHGEPPTDLCAEYTSTKRAGEGVNSLTPTSREWLDALSRLTLRRDLLSLTMLRWEGLLPPVGLMRERKAWCPACYQEAEDANDEQYDQLLWCVQDATCCLDHACRLVSTCPHCGKHNPHLGWKNRAGYCNACCEWLGTMQVDRVSVTPWDRWRTEEAGSLLAAPQTEMPMASAKERTMGALRALAAARGIRKTGKLAKLLGFRREGVVDWFYGKVSPSFSSLLVICGRFGVGLLDMMFADLDVLATTAPNPNVPEPPERVYIRRPKAELEAVLKEALKNADPADSLRTVCERAGFGRSGGRARCPELSKEITARRREHLKAQVGSKQQKVFEEARELIQQAKGQNLDLAPASLAQMLSQPGVLRADWARSAFREALKAEGIDAVWPTIRAKRKTSVETDSISKESTSD